MTLFEAPVLLFTPTHTFWAIGVCARVSFLTLASLAQDEEEEEEDETVTRCVTPPVDGEEGYESAKEGRALSDAESSESEAESSDEEDSSGEDCEDKYFSRSPEDGEEVIKTPVGMGGLELKGLQRIKFVSTPPSEGGSFSPIVRGGLLKKPTAMTRESGGLVERAVERSAFANLTNNLR